MRVQACTSIDDLMAKIDQDAARPHRFPSRFILIRGLEAWQNVITQLESKTNDVIRLSELCLSSDVLPESSRINAALLARRKLSVMVLPVSELIRFRPSSIDDLVAWMRLEDPGVARYYFPLFDSDDVFAQATERVHRYEMGLIPAAWKLEGGCSVQLEAAPFAPNLSQSKAVVAVGVQRYLDIWESGGSPNIYLQSRQANRLTERISAISVRTFLQPFDYISTELIDLPKEADYLGSQDEWAWLLTQLYSENSFALIAARILNVLSYNKWHVFAKWKDYSPQERWIAWLWARECEPSDTYLGRCALSCQTWSDLPEMLVLHSFDPNQSLADLAERRRLLLEMEISDATGQFWDRYEHTTDDKIKLRALWGASERQKKEAIRVVARLLQNRVNEVEWYNVLELTFPQLASYLRAPSGIDSDLSHYISIYVRGKLTSPDNQLYRNSIDSLTMKALSSGLYLRHSTREKILESCASCNYVFWVDAMGLEWIELLRYELEQQGVDVYKLHVARSNLPSITETNKGSGWENESQLERGLDVIAHRNTYQSIADLLYDQFAVISRVASRVSDVVNDGNCIAITADHGLTALLTDKRISPFEDMLVDHGGRFGSFKSSNVVLMRDKNGPWIIESRNGLEYICLADHSRFKGSKGSSCEAHGGATIEESLVPVLFVTGRQGTKRRLPQVSSFPSTVRLSPNGKAIINIRIDGHANSVELRIGTSLYQAVQVSEHDWTISVTDVLPGAYSVSIMVDNRKAHKATTQFTKGITSDDMGI